MSGRASDEITRAGARVLVVEPSKLLRDGIRAALVACGAEVVAEASEGGDAIAAAAAHRPDVVLIDAELPDRSWEEVCASILVEHDSAALVVLSNARDEPSVRAALAAGARGYLLKQSDSLDIAAAVERVVAGETVTDPGVAAVGAGSHDPPRLTPQELNVMRLVAEGRTNPEIGKRLYLSRHTVKEYVSHAMRKLDATNRIEAVRKAAALGLVEVPGGPQRREQPPPRSALVFNELGKPKQTSELKVQPLKVEDLRADGADAGDHSR